MRTVNIAALAEAIRKKRGKEPFQKVADELGIHQTTLIECEKGHKTRISANTYVTLCGWLGRDPFEFVLQED